MAAEQTGAIIESGLTDWQIIQQDEQGYGAVNLTGRWVGEAGGAVQVRLVHEASAAPVAAHLDWTSAKTRADGTWSASLARIPAGGLYRLETRYRPRGLTDGEWSFRGDMRHFVGVGDLWVIAGQSNSAGYGRGPIYDPPQLGVHLFRNSEQWALATHPLNESTDSRHSINSEVANSGHAPYLHFAKRLQAALGYPIGLVQTSLGGTPLQRWNPTEPGNADLYENMLHCVRSAGGRVKGILWYQGESDTPLEQATTYLQRFKRAVATWRKGLKNPKLAVLTVQLNRVTVQPTPEAEQGWSAIREAQRQAARQLPNVAVVPTFDLTLTDTIHISSEGNLVLGERLANAALGMVHCKAVSYMAPDAESARLLKSGRAIEISFTNVTNRIGCNDVSANCFRVEDGNGEVDIEKVEYPGNNTLILWFTRAASTPLTVHGAWGADPDVGPMDMERQMPMLGFTLQI